jgi:hypothetical protein
MLPAIRLYLAYFLRTPDVGGIRFWAEKHAAGTRLRTISSSFAASSEFTRRYGKLSDAAFVDLVYRNVLGRPADSGGASYWRSKLRTGETRGSMMVAFSESSEYVRKTKTKTSVIALALGLLDRAPTQAEIDQWSNDAALFDVARQMMWLPDYEARVDRAV